MANYLKMQKRQQVIALLELGWTYSRIEPRAGAAAKRIGRAPGQMLTASSTMEDGLGVE